MNGAVLFLRLSRFSKNTVQDRMDSVMDAEHGAWIPAPIDLPAEPTGGIYQFRSLHVYILQSEQTRALFSLQNIL